MNSLYLNESSPSAGSEEASKNKKKKESGGMETKIHNCQFLLVLISFFVVIELSLQLLLSKIYAHFYILTFLCTLEYICFFSVCRDHLYLWD